MQKFCSNLQLTFSLLDDSLSFSGMYSCHATNKEGSGHSNVVSLTVQCKLNIYQSHNSSYLLLYETSIHIFTLVKPLCYTLIFNSKVMCRKAPERKEKMWLYFRSCVCVLCVRASLSKKCEGHSSLYAWQTLNLKLALVPNTVGNACRIQENISLFLAARKKLNKFKFWISLTLTPLKS